MFVLGNLLLLFAISFYLTPAEVLSSCLLVSLGSCFQNLKDSCLVEIDSWTLLFIRFSLILPSWFPFLHIAQAFRDISFWSTALTAFAVLQFYF